MNVKTIRTHANAAVTLVAMLQAEAERLGVDPHDIDEIVALRVSTRAMAMLKNQLGAVRLFAANAAVGPWIEQHGDRLLTSDRADLAAHHILRVEEGHLVPGYASRARVGYVALVENPDSGRWTVILAVADTAVGRKLPSREQAGGLSSWAQLVTWAWTWAAAARTLRFVRDDRMARDLEVFAPINGRVKERPGAVYWWGDERIDPRKDDWRAVIGATTSAAGARDTKERTFSGRATAWEDNRWAEKEEYLPAGLHLPVVIDEQGVAAKSPYPVVDPQQAPIVQRMWERAAQGWKMTAIACEAASDGARNGRGALLAIKLAPLMSAKQREHARTLCDTLPEQEARRLADALDRAGEPLPKVARTARRRAATEAAKRVMQYLDFYRTGTLTKLWTNPLPGTVVTDGGHPLTFVVDDPRLVPPDADPEHVFTTTEFECRYPDHPLLKVRAENAERYAEICHLGFVHDTLVMPTPVTLTDEEWKAARGHIPPGWLERRRTGIRKEQSLPTAPLSQLRWTEGDQELRIWQDHGAYEILTGPLAAPVEQCTRLARVDCDALHQQLGDWLVSTGRQLDVAVEPLPLLTSHTTPTVEDTDPVAVAETRLANLENQLEQKEKLAAGFLRDRAACDLDTQRGTREHAQLQTQIDNVHDETDALEQQIQQAKEAVEAARDLAVSEPAITQPAGELFTVEVDANPLVVVGARLQHLAETSQHLDLPQLSQAVAWMLRDGRLLAFRYSEGRDVHLDIEGLQLPGRDVPHCIAGTTLTLTDTRGRLRGKPVDPTLPTLRDEAARYVLRDRNAKEFRKRRNWSLAFLVEELRDWLHDHGVAPGAATAIIDSALTGDHRIPVGPTVYAWCTTGDDDEGGNDLRWKAAKAAAAKLDAESITQPIVTAYIDHGTHLPARSTGWVRRPLANVRRLIDLLAAQTPGACSRADVATALGISRADLRDLITQDTPLLPVAVTHDSIRLLECERPKCGGQLTVVVAVPETMLLGTTDGALVACGKCRRPAGHYWSDRVLPEVYRERWDTPVARANLHNEGHRSRVVPTPDLATVQLPERTFSMATTARKLGIATSSLRRLIDDQVIRAIANHDNRGGYRIPARELVREEVVDAATALRERRYRPRGR